MKTSSKKGPSWANEMAVDTINPSMVAGPSKVVENERNVADNDTEEWKGFGSSSEPPEKQREEAEEVDDLEWMRRRMKGINTSDAGEDPSQQSNEEGTGTRVCSKRAFFSNF